MQGPRIQTKFTRPFPLIEGGLWEPENINVHFRFLAENSFCSVGVGLISEVKYPLAGQRYKVKISTQELVGQRGEWAYFQDTVLVKNVFTS